MDQKEILTLEGKWKTVGKGRAQESEQKSPTDSMTMSEKRDKNGCSMHEWGFHLTGMKMNGSL